MTVPVTQTSMLLLRKSTDSDFAALRALYSGRILGLRARTEKNLQEASAAGFLFVLYCVKDQSIRGVTGVFRHGFTFELGGSWIDEPLRGFGIFSVLHGVRLEALWSAFIERWPVVWVRSTNSVSKAWYKANGYELTTAAFLRDCGIQIDIADETSDRDYYLVSANVALGLVNRHRDTTIFRKNGGMSRNVWVDIVCDASTKSEPVA